MTPQAFIKLLKPFAQRAEQGFGLPWQAMIAQAALETGWLSHPTKDKHTEKDSFNLFNIKASGNWKGGTCTVDTHEYTNGKLIRIEAKFRAYMDYGDSFTDYCKFIIKNPRYKPVLAVRGDPLAYAAALEECGYATDPKYAEKLAIIIKKYFA